MEYIYASMLLHKAGKKITEESVAKVLEAAGVQTDVARTKALVAALETVNIEEAIKTAAPVAAVAASTTATPEAKPGKEEKKEKEKKEEKEEVEGLGALFG
ncbi:MAG: 50S ribosomal protein P1 [Candidatus Jordarchaeaceae archaeon]